METNNPTTCSFIFIQLLYIGGRIRHLSFIQVKVKVSFDSRCVVRSRSFFVIKTIDIATVVFSSSNCLSKGVFKSIHSRPTVQGSGKSISRPEVRRKGPLLHRHYGSRFPDGKYLLINGRNNFDVWEVIASTPNRSNR